MGSWGQYITYGEMFRGTCRVCRAARLSICRSVGDCQEMSGFVGLSDSVGLSECRAYVRLSDWNLTCLDRDGTPNRVHDLKDYVGGSVGVCRATRGVSDSAVAC